LFYKQTEEIRYNNNFWEEPIAYFPLYDMYRIENDASNNSSIFPCVFVAAVKFFTKPLLSNDKGIVTEPLLGLATIWDTDTQIYRRAL
jgi:hypothetical protein